MSFVKNKRQVITPVLMVKYNILIKDPRQDIYGINRLQLPIENNVITGK